MINSGNSLKERIAAKQAEVKAQEQNLTEGTSMLVNDLSPGNIMSKMSNNLVEKVIPSGIAKNDLLMTGLSLGGTFLFNNVVKRNMGAIKKGAAIAGVAALAVGLGVYQYRKIKERKAHKRLKKAVAKARLKEASTIEHVPVKPPVAAGE